MTRGKRKRKNSQPPQSTRPATQQWSTGELKTILVEAILEAEHRKEQEWNQRKKEKRTKLARIMGEEDLSQYKGVQRLWKEIVSSFKIIYHIVFLKRGLTEGFYVENFVKSMIMLFFLFIGLVLYGVALCVIGFVVIYILGRNFQNIHLFEILGRIFMSIPGAILSFIFFVVARCFHNMVYEVFDMEDQGLLFSLFAVLIAFVSLIFSILTFVKGG